MIPICDTGPGLNRGLFYYALAIRERIFYNSAQEVSLTKAQDTQDSQAGQGQGTQTDVIQFVANLTNRQSSLMHSGSGDRTLIELEAFGVWSLVSLVGLAKFTGKQFLVTVQELPENWTKLYHETDQKPEGQIIRVGRRGPGDRGD